MPSTASFWSPLLLSVKRLRVPTEIARYRTVCAEANSFLANGPRPHIFPTTISQLPPHNKQVRMLRSLLLNRAVVADGNDTVVATHQFVATGGVARELCRFVVASSVAEDGEVGG